MNGTALLLVGSARTTASTSGSLGGYLLDRLAERGVEGSTRPVASTTSRSGLRELLDELDRADLLVLASPVYVDSLPCLVTRALERIDAYRRRREILRPTRLVAVLACGLPEPERCDVALGICRSFARRAGLGWAGGLALGGAAAIGGRPLRVLGRTTRHARAALELTAKALVEGRTVPEQAVAWMARPMLPARAYTALASLGWLREASGNGALARLWDRPLS